mgnify:CR=1 FL=1
MSVSNTVTDVIYAADGVQDTFAITFDFKDSSHVKVISKVIATGAETLLTEGADYNVVGTDVVMASAPAATKVIIIYRVSPRTQTTDYLTSGPFLPEDHEEAMDKLALQIQELQREINRCVKFSLGDYPAIDPELVSPPTADSVLVINSTLDGMGYMDPSLLVGPTGPQGPTGATGANGADGAAGAGILRAGVTSISNGANSVTVAFSSATPNTSYVPVFAFRNLVDSDPIFLIGMIVNKTTTGFTVLFNTAVDSANYALEYQANDAI